MLLGKEIRQGKCTHPKQNSELCLVHVHDIVHVHGIYHVRVHVHVDQ